MFDLADHFGVANVIWKVAGRDRAPFIRSARSASTTKFLGIQTQGVDSTLAPARTG
jgi:hypothetical protein